MIHLLKRSNDIPVAWLTQLQSSWSQISVTVTPGTDREQRQKYRTWEAFVLQQRRHSKPFFFFLMYSGGSASESVCFYDIHISFTGKTDSTQIRSLHLCIPHADLHGVQLVWTVVLINCYVEVKCCSAHRLCHAFTCSVFQPLASQSYSICSFETPTQSLLLKNNSFFNNADSVTLLILCIKERSHLGTHPFFQTSEMLPF